MRGDRAEAARESGGRSDALAVGPLAAVLFFYVLATGLGVALRFFFVLPFGGIVFGNAVHAHSHTLYFGWGALGIFTLLYGALGLGGKGAKGLLGTIALLSALTFVFFLEGGYSTPSIVLSAASLPIWFLASLFAWRGLRRERGLDVAYLRVGLLYLVLASVAALSRVALMALDAPPLHGKLAVFAFLNCFAWFFVFSVVGLLLRAERGRGLRSEAALRWLLRLGAPLAWLAFPLGVAGGSEGWIGWLGRLAALGLAAPLCAGGWTLWKKGRVASDAALAWIGLWLVGVGLLSLVGGLGFAERAVASRHLAVLFLHLLLLGVISLCLMVLVLDAFGVSVGRELWLHNGGLLVMVGGLFAAGAPIFGLPLPDGLPRFGVVAAAVGGATIFAAGLSWAFRAWFSLRAKRHADAAPSAGPSQEKRASP